MEQQKKPYSIQDMIDRYEGTNRQSWASHRFRGTGPAFFKVGKKVFYRQEDVLAWEQSQVISRTDESPAA